MAPAFALFSTPFLPSASRSRPSLSPIHRPPSLQRAARMRARVPTAVLETPAGNTYLQRHAELVLRDYLTRRAVQTVLYYMHELRDSPSFSWLRGFDGFAKRVADDKFADGDAFVQRMLHAPRQKGTMKVGHPAGRFSRTYSFVIQPDRIAKRVVAIRGQLAAEWAVDLRCIEQENLEIQRMGFERILCKNEQELDSRRNLIFDSDPMGSDHTPLRYKNYHGLKTLITQHAVARLLPYTRDCGPNHEYMYLLQFVSSYGAIKNGDDFVRALMDRPVEQRTHPSHLIQPRAIAMQVLELRRAIAEEWIAVMEYVPEEEMMNARNSLERSMKMGDVPSEDARKSGDESDDSGASVGKGAEGSS